MLVFRFSILHQNFTVYLLFLNDHPHHSVSVTCLLSLSFSLFSLFYSLKLVGGGWGGGVVLLIEILYRVSMGIVNFVERERKTARVNG